MEDFVIYYSTNAKTGEVTETIHYLTDEEKAEYATLISQETLAADPVEKLKQFLATNPDVAAILN